MYEIHEIFPIVAGVAYGLTFYWQSKTRKGVLLLGLAAIVTAIVASTISGELALSWWYVIADLAEILAAAAITVVGAAALRSAARFSVR